MITSLYSHLLCRMFYSGGMKPYYSTAESSVGFPQKCPSAPHHASLYYLLSQITAALNSVSEITHSRRRIRSRKKPNSTTLIFPSSFFQTTFCFSPSPTHDLCHHWVDITAFDTSYTLSNHKNTYSL